MLKYEIDAIDVMCISCIGIIVGIIVAGMTGQIYYIPLFVGVGAVGDFLIFKNFIKLKSSKKSTSRFSCCGIQENKEHTNEQKTN